MAWVKLDDNAINHPKILALSDGAFRLWIAGLCYAQTHLTDGLIPAAAVRSLHSSTRARLAELTKPWKPGAEPLWEATADGLLIHDYLTWNDDRQTVLSRRAESDAARAAERTATRERLRRWREQKKHSSNAGCNAYSNGSGNAPVTVLTTPHHTEESRKTPTLQRQPPVSAGSKRPVFKGRAVVVFEWMLAELMAMLGAHTNDFGLDEWFYTLDDMALNETSVVSDRWKWIKTKTLDEAKRRGLGDGPDDVPHAWRCPKCGEIHEGTGDQARRFVCLKQPSAVK